MSLENKNDRRDERLSDKAYRRLRDGIITLEFEPMAPLNERTLSEQLNMGRAPIREALRRLEHERLVSIYPRVGVFAAEIVITDQQSIKEIRFELEGLAAALASTRGTPEEGAVLTQLADDLVILNESSDKIMGDAKFRRHIYAMTRNSFLQDILETHHNLSMRLWYFCRRQRSRANIGPLDYRPIAQAIADGDADTARRLLSAVVAEHSALLHAMLV